MYYITGMENKTQATPKTAVSVAVIPEDEVNILEIVYVLVKYKVIIALISVIGLVGGYVAAVAHGPAYVASATIMAKENDRQGSGLGALGMLGSLASGQFNLAGNPGLDKIEVHFDSRQFKAEFIEKYGLLDDIYKYGQPRAYEKFYDTANGRWVENEKFPAPDPMKAAGILGKKFFRKEVDSKKGVMVLSVRSPDSVFSIGVVEGSLEHLNRYIQASVQKDAKDNVDFLEQQLITIADPLLREKLQGMIAAEIEKAMIISKEAFKVIDRPYCAKRHREKIIYPAIGFAAMFLVSSAAMIFLYYTAGDGNTNDESKRWVDKIRRQLLKF